MDPKGSIPKFATSLSKSKTGEFMANFRKVAIAKAFKKRSFHQFKINVWATPNFTQISSFRNIFEDLNVANVLVGRIYPTYKRYSFLFSIKTFPALWPLLVRGLQIDR